RLNPNGQSHTRAVTSLSPPVAWLELSERRAGRRVEFRNGQGEEAMDREHVKGAGDKAKGAVKDTAGKLTGDDKLRAEGKMDKAKGDLHNAAGDVKDAFRKATETE